MVVNDSIWTYFENKDDVACSENVKRKYKQNWDTVLGLKPIVVLHHLGIREQEKYNLCNNIVVFQDSSITN